MPNISYKEEGKGEIILFLHGWGQNKEMMIPLAEHLKNKYRCVFIDLPGFGKSDFNNAKNIEEYTKYLRDFLIQNEIKPKYIIGHSFGGKLAISYYLKYKDLEKIVIISSPLLKPYRGIKYYSKVYLYKIKKKLKMKNNNGGSNDYKNCSKEMKSFFINIVNTYYKKDLKSIEIPVLLLWGNKDEKVSLLQAKKIHKRIKNSDLYILKGDHFAYFYNIELSKLVIQQFVRRR